jgi:hypothetical protein
MRFRQCEPTRAGRFTVADHPSSVVVQDEGLWCGVDLAAQNKKTHKSLGRRHVRPARTSRHMTQHVRRSHSDRPARTAEGSNHSRNGVLARAHVLAQVW